MRKQYPNVITRFLADHERLVAFHSIEFPLVIEASINKNLDFLTDFLHTHADDITQDIAYYGAVLLRGFAVQSNADFQDVVLSIPSMQPMREAFMSEEG